jgi:PUCC protein
MVSGPISRASSRGSSRGAGGGPVLGRQLELPDGARKGPGVCGRADLRSGDRRAREHRESDPSDDALPAVRAVDVADAADHTLWAHQNSSAPNVAATKLVHGAPWPLKESVFVLGVANGSFSIAAIGSMMTMASHETGGGRGGREGVRMGLWGPAQAIAFGVGGFAGTVLVDLSKWVVGPSGGAYAFVFALEAVGLFRRALARTANDLRRGRGRRAAEGPLFPGSGRAGAVVGDDLRHHECRAAVRRDSAEPGVRIAFSAFAAKERMKCDKNDRLPQKTATRLRDV